MAQSTLHVSLLVGRRHSCGQLGTAPKGQKPKEVGGTSSCCLGPLGSRSQPCQPCRSSSSQTMRVIFSQRFNTSQLASVQGGSPPPPSPPRRPDQPVPYAAAAPASLFVYLVVSAQLLLTPHQKYNPSKRKPKNQSLIKGPSAKIKKVQTWEAQQPLQTPTLLPALRLAGVAQERKRNRSVARSHCSPHGPRPRLALLPTQEMKPKTAFLACCPPILLFRGQVWRR